jgi:hypothetical protein
MRDFVTDPAGTIVQVSVDGEETFLASLHLGTVDLMLSGTTGSLTCLEFLQFTSRSLRLEAQLQSLVVAQAVHNRFASNGDTLAWMLVGHSI